MFRRFSMAVAFTIGRFLLSRAISMKDITVFCVVVLACARAAMAVQDRPGRIRLQAIKSARDGPLCSGPGDRHSERRPRSGRLVREHQLQTRQLEQQRDRDQPAPVDSGATAGAPWRDRVCSVGPTRPTPSIPTATSSVRPTWAVYRKAFYLPAGGSGVVLPTLSPSSPSAYGMGVSDNGFVAGYSTASDGNIHAFVWSASGGMIDLGSSGQASYAQRHQCQRQHGGRRHQPASQ